MQLSGTFEIYGTTYFVSLEEVKSKRTWKVISTVHEEDMGAELLGAPYTHRILDLNDMLARPADLGYLAEALVQSKVSDKMQVYKRSQIIQEISELIHASQTYVFTQSDTIEDSVTADNGVVHKVKIAKDFNINTHYEKRNGKFTRIYVEKDGKILDMREGYKFRTRGKIEYVAVADTRAKDKRQISSVTALDYEALCDILDMSWYEKDGKILKDYRTIKNIKEFEDFVMTPMMESLMEHKARGEKLLLGGDSETTGLLFYDLSEDNENREEMVSFQFSWEDDQGVVVFLDMEEHSNVPREYFLERIKDVIEYSSGHRKIPKRIVTVNEGGYDEDGNIVPDAEFTIEEHGYWEFEREDILLTGHNAPFDARVLLFYGIKSYWDEDTLQMCFDINPRVAKGAVALKNLIKKLLGIEPPELSDILGKGNEGNYKYIPDERVAMIYGCADTDHVRMLWKVARNAMSNKMYKMYKTQDIPIMNRLVVSEFKGLPLDMENFLKDGKVVEDDLEMLREYLFRYVGRVVDKRNKTAELVNLRAVGAISDEEFIERKKQIVLDPDAMYDFKIGGDDLRRVIFEVLEYPPVMMTNPSKKHPEGQPSIDKYAMERMLKFELEVPSKVLSSDIISTDGKTVLISAKTFNKKRYPIAYFLSVYKKFEKEFTSYYEPIRKTSLERRLFKSYSMARIETRRIMNPAQTMKWNMKKNVVSLGEDWYLCDFDQMQVEPRIMISLSDNEEDKEKFRNPEKDYHTETAARILGIAPHMLTKYMRKIFKEISLGLPYGLGDMKMAEKIHHSTSNEALFKTRCAIEDWKKFNKDKYDRLLEFRKKGLEPITDMSEAMKDFLWKTTRTEEDPDPKVYGKSDNLFGFYRLFDLTNLVPGDSKAEGKIMRPSGNYPIQSLAAEIFRKILMRFYNRCVEEGIEDKVVWHMLIHDELLMSVHKSVHPFLLYKILYETCTITFKEHTTYFIGINIGDTWAECKDDKNEAPVNFVRRVIQRWDAGEFRDDDYKSDVKGYVKRHMRQYFNERIAECVFEVDKKAKSGAPINLPKLMKEFDNYVVRAYVTMHYKPNREVDETLPEDVFESQMYEACFESWIIEALGEGTLMRGLDGKVRPVHKGIVIEKGDELSMEDEEETEEFWSFEDDDLDEIAYSHYNAEIDNDSWEDKMLAAHEEYIRKGEEKIIEIRKEEKYKNVNVVNGKLVVKLRRGIHANKLKQYLNSERSKEGLTVVIKHPLGNDTWTTVNSGVNLKELDAFVGGL